MQCACAIFDIADLCACEFYKGDILYCACRKIHFEFTQGPILGNMYGYIIEEEETQNGKLWKIFLENHSEFQMLAPQYDQRTHQYVFEEVYNHGPSTFEVIRMPDHCVQHPQMDNYKFHPIHILITEHNISYMLHRVVFNHVTAADGNILMDVRKST